MTEERYQEIVEAIGSEFVFPQAGEFNPTSFRQTVLEKGRQLGVSPQEAREFIGMVLQKHGAIDGD